MTLPNHADEPGWTYLRQPPSERLKAASTEFDSKKNVWIPDENDGYVAAEIISTRISTIKVVTNTGQEMTLKKDDLKQMNPPKYNKAEDMAELTFLNEASVLHNLRERYYSMMIYTYSGLFCLAINPYKWLPIYTEDICRMYRGKRRSEMPPHLFAVSNKAYRNMIDDRMNQSLLITGESGAGKTENTKKVISYFAVVGGVEAHEDAQMINDVSSPRATIEEQIVRTNPVLEAFGNAKTVRNNNSSRFGKFIRIHFSSGGKLASADIEHCLLEKSRVIKQAPGERSYHIFYQLMSGGIEGLKEKLFLTDDIRKYHLISQAEIAIDGVDDKKELRLIDDSFDIMNFTECEKLRLYELVAGIMHMGEAKFKQRPREEQAECEDQTGINLASKLWKVDQDNFTLSLLKPKVNVGVEWVNKGQNLEQVYWAVGALAKAIYVRMFAWLIKRCNKTLDAMSTNREHFIGVLDIAGFEIFDLNSFEQLWINLVNEKLQQFFNHHMFVIEQEEYKREEIEWEFMDFGLDLQPCVDLIEKPLGILSLLDEECIVPKATDGTLAQKLNDQHLGKTISFQKPKPPRGKQAEAHFAIVHYAGTVRYNVNDWLEKNKDPLNDTAVSVLKANAGMELMSQIWADYETQEDTANLSKEGKTTSKKKGKSASFMTVSMIYRKSLSCLLEMLQQTHPHFIRCIIPNERKESGVINARLVLNQLTCNGVLEGIRICRKGYPNRMIHKDFKWRYSILAPKAAQSDSDSKMVGKAMCTELQEADALKLDDYRIGLTKIFFKSGVLAHLEDLRDKEISIVITKIQCACRYNIEQADVERRKRRRVGTIIIQKNIRFWCKIRGWDWFILYTRLKPMINSREKTEIHKTLDIKLKELEERILTDQKLRIDLESLIQELLRGKETVLQQLEEERNNLFESENQKEKIANQKIELEKQMNELNDELADVESENGKLKRQRNKFDNEIECLQKDLIEMELSIQKHESDRQTKDHQIKVLQNEVVSQNDMIAKINKERKSQEEIYHQITDDLHAKEDKLNNAMKTKAKMEQALDESEDSLNLERRSRQDAEKFRRKVEGELRIAQENIDELSRQKQDIQIALKKKDAEMQSLITHLEDEQTLVGKLQKHIKELTAKIEDVEDEVDAQKQARIKSEKLRNEIQVELEELIDRLDEAGGATQAQIELNKKREAEICKLRWDLEEAAAQSDHIVEGLRRKHNDAIVEMSNQLEMLQTARAKVEKEKTAFSHEIEELRNMYEAEVRQRRNSDRFAKQIESQLNELQIKNEEQIRLNQEILAAMNKLQFEHSELNRNAEYVESRNNLLSRMKNKLGTELEEIKEQLDNETREKQRLNAQNANFQMEREKLRTVIDGEEHSKIELQRSLSKVNAEVQEWRTRYQEEGVVKTEEMEETRRRLQSRVQEIQETLSAENVRTGQLEKSKQALIHELEDARVDAEKANSMLVSLEKRQKEFDKIVDEWKQKYDSIVQELDENQRAARNSATECYRLQANLDEANEQITSLRHENIVLTQDLHGINDQVSEYEKSVQVLQREKRRLEVEKEELQLALNDMETTVETQESKFLRAQVEISQIRSDFRRTIAEKEEEFENTRKNHQISLESMQATIENEARGRTELAHVRKKMESDISEFELALEQACEANAEAQENLKKYQEANHDLQMRIEEEQRQGDIVREQLNNAERRLQALQAEREEISATQEQTDRLRRQAELECMDLRETANILSNTSGSATATKRKLEMESQQLRAEINEMQRELKKSEDRIKKSIIDVARLSDELQTEQEHSSNLERQKRCLEQEIKEIQTRLNESETQALKSSKRILAKLEQKVHELESELSEEVRKHIETQKNLRSKDRRMCELQFKVDEDKKSAERMYELVEKLQGKIKVYKRQLEETEHLATENLSKYRQVQYLCKDAEERAEVAESSVMKMRTKVRSMSTLQGISRSVSYMGLSSSRQSTRRMSNKSEDN